MFTQNHVGQIKKKLETEIQKTIFLRASALENAYKENPIVADADVSINGENIDVYVKLNFEAKDDEQNIPGVLEYGGVIFDAEDKPHEIEPGFYMRRIMAYGLPE
jgi:hypothetical protein